MLCSPLDNPEYVTGLSPTHIPGEQRQFREMQMHNTVIHNTVTYAQYNDQAYNTNHTRSMSMIFASARLLSLVVYMGGGGGGGGGGVH